MTSFQGVLQIYELLVSVAFEMKSLELRVDGFLEGGKHLINLIKGIKSGDL